MVKVLERFIMWLSQRLDRSLFMVPEIDER
jgi:hypothetical protein